MIDSDLPKVSIYTDGSCLGNPGPGGWGVLMLCKDFRKELSGAFKETTNNRMELLAVINALETLKRPCIVEIYTDSKYVCDAINKKWLFGWKKKGWKKADNKPVLNQDLWERFYPLYMKLKPTMIWVRGHNGHPENEFVDDLARAAAGMSNLPVDTGFTPAP